MMGHPQNQQWSDSERRPLLRHIAPVPIPEDENEDDNQPPISGIGSYHRAPARARQHEHEHGPIYPSSTSTAAKVVATVFSFAVLGMMLSTMGVMLPHLEAHYGLTDAQVSLMFLAMPWGYVVGAWLNGPVHRRFGQRGIAAAAPICQALFTGLAARFHDAAAHRHGFTVFVAALVVGNLGGGLLDGSWCAWAGGQPGPHRNAVLGLLHAGFSTGAGLGPFLAATMLSTWEAPWWSWFYVLLSAVLLQAIVLAWAFRFEDGARYRDGLVEEGIASKGIASKKRNQVVLEQEEEEEEAAAAAAGEADEDEDEDEEEECEAPPVPAARRWAYKGALRYAVTWICAAYFLLYVGTEAALSGWIVAFMLRARRASPFLASLACSAFWTGMTVGRLVLVVVTDKMGGVRTAVIVYLVMAMLAQAVLAAVDATVVSATAAAWVGFFLGPLYPSGIVLLARLLPKDLHVGAVSFVASVGQLGAALLPFATGWLVHLLGIRVFQLFILALLLLTLLIWLLFPKLPAVDTTDGRRSET